MVMSITLALQQKHQDEQNSLCNAVKLLMQSPGYIQVFVKKKIKTQQTYRQEPCFYSSPVGRHWKRFLRRLLSFLFSSWTAH